jgi:hypothetical protein
MARHRAANRGIAIGRGNWTFGSDHGGKTAAELLSVIATCKRNAVEPFGWFCDVLSRIATHRINKIEELLPSLRACPSLISRETR